MAWRGAAGGLFEAAVPVERGRDHRQSVRLGWPSAAPGWLECSDKAPHEELPAERDQGLGTWIRERTDRPLEQARGRDGLLEGGLDFRSDSRRWQLGRRTTSLAAFASAGVRRWVGRKVCLSSDSYLL